MKKTHIALKPFFFLFVTILIFNACDTDYSSISSDVLGEENFNFEVADSSFPVLAYNQNLTGQQINALPSYLLGFYNDPIYGSTSASIVTQLLPSSFNPKFGETARIDSVKLVIPYLSQRTGTSDNRIPLYRLNYFYVRNNAIENIDSIKLTVYENKYFLNTLDIDSPDPQIYYSLTNGTTNNTEHLAQTKTGTINFDANTGFTFFEGHVLPSSEARKQISGTGSSATTTYLKPGLEIELAQTQDEKDYWTSLILDQEGEATLSNANNFQNYFRGLYIKAEPLNDNGSMFLVNLADSDAKITINYSTDENDDGEREKKTYTFTFSGNRLNTFVNNYNTNLPATPNIVDGDEKLFIKGTEGAMAVVELFNSDENAKIDCNCGKDSQGNAIIVNVTALDCFKKTYRKTDDNGQELSPVNGSYQLKRLINEAHLVVYEDETLVTPRSSDNEYPDFDKLFVYDISDNVVIPDYNSDPTIDTRDPLVSRRYSLAKTIDDDGFAMYKIKVTDFLNSILTNATDEYENATLGLVHTNNVNVNTITDLLDDTNTATGIPVAAVTTPKGTVLHGSNSSNPDKRLKLNIYYTNTK